MQATNAPRSRGRLRRLWSENPYFSTGMALALLLLIMTGVLIWKNDFDSFAAFSRSWSPTASTSAATTPSWASSPWA